MIKMKLKNKMKSNKMSKKEKKKKKGMSTDSAVSYASSILLPSSAVGT